MDTTTSLLFGMLAGVMAAQGAMMLAVEKEGWGQKKPGQGQLNTATMACYRGVAFKDLAGKYPQLNDLQEGPIREACDKGYDKYWQDVGRVSKERAAGKKCGAQVGECNTRWLKHIRPCGHSKGNMCCNFVGVKDDRTCVDKSFANFPPDTVFPETNRGSANDRAKGRPGPNVAPWAKNPAQNGQNKPLSATERLQQLRQQAQQAQQGKQPTKKPALKPVSMTVFEWQKLQRELPKRLEAAWQELKKKYPDTWLPEPGVRWGNQSKNADLHHMCPEGDYVDWLQFYYDDQGVNSIKVRCRSGDGKRWTGQTQLAGKDVGAQKQVDYPLGFDIVRIATGGNQVRALEIKNAATHRTTGFGGDTSYTAETKQCPKGTVITGVSAATGDKVDSLAFRCGPMRLQ